MPRRPRSEALDTGRFCCRGRVCLVVEVEARGVRWEPRPGLLRLTGGEREAAADWLRGWFPRLTHDECYAMLFG